MPALPKGSAREEPPARRARVQASAASPNQRSAEGASPGAHAGIAEHEQHLGTQPIVDVESTGDDPLEQLGGVLVGEAAHGLLGGPFSAKPARSRGVDEGARIQQVTRKLGMRQAYAATGGSPSSTSAMRRCSSARRVLVISGEHRVAGGACAKR